MNDTTQVGFTIELHHLQQHGNVPKEPGVLLQFIICRLPRGWRAVANYALHHMVQAKMVFGFRVSIRGFSIYLSRNARAMQTTVVSVLSHICFVMGGPQTGQWYPGSIARTHNTQTA